jgi:outer membrane usher protein
MLFAAATSAAGQKAPARSYAITLPLLFADAYLGDIPAKVSLDGQVSFPVERLKALLGDRLTPELVARLSAAADEQGTLSAAAVTSAGITLTYDPARLELSAAIPVAAQCSRAVSASAVRDRSRLSPALQPAPASASIALSASQTFFHADGQRRPGLGPLRIVGDIAGNLGGSKGVYVFSELVYDESARNRLARGNTTLVHDDQPAAIRYSAGDLSLQPQGFQSAPLVGGLAVERSYTELQPFRNIRPGGDFRFVLDRPAIVEIVANGVPLRRIRLEAGQYDLRDLPFLNGLNRIELYTTDEFGRQLLASFSQFFGSQLLNPGISEFGASIGLAQTRGAGGLIAYDSGRPIASGYLRAGVSQSLTLGANMQGEPARQMAGIEAAWSSPVGVLAVVAAGSRDSLLGTGTRFLLGYDLGNRGGVLVKDLQLNLEYQRTSFAFTTAGVERATNRFRDEFRGRLAAVLGSSLSFGLFGNAATRHDRPGTDHRLGATLGGSLGPLNLLGSIERGRTAETGRETRLLFTATLPLGPQSNARLTYDSTRDVVAAEYNRFEYDEVGDYGIRAKATRDRDQLAGEGEARYVGNRVRAALVHEAVARLRDDRLSQQTSWQLATQIAYAGGRLALGRPVGPSFAIVAPHETLGNSRIEVRQGLGRDRPQALSGPLGPALAPIGALYTDQQLIVEVPDAPRGYDVGPGSFDIFPGAASGYRITIGSDASLTAIGTLVDSAGKPVELQGGSLASLDDPARAPRLIFTNRAGRFVADGLAPGRYRLSLGRAEAYTAEFRVTPSGDGAVNLGTITATGPATGGQ